MVTRGWREEKTGTYCLMGIVFSVLQDKRVLKRMDGCVVVDNVNIPHATELYT